VANISEFLTAKLTIEEFRQLLLENIFEGNNEIPEYVLTEEDWEKIHQISEERYQSWEWNYGKSPNFNFQNSHRFPVGSIDVRLEVSQGIINSAKIYGDFFGTEDVQDIEECLKNKRYDRTSLEIALGGIEYRSYFGNITKEDFLNLFY
jgi:lipoate-protein ligase A